MLGQIEKELLSSFSLWKKAVASLDKRKGVEAGLLSRLEKITKVVDALRKEHEERAEQTLHTVKEKTQQHQGM